jgi:site-specific recombinase XerD
MSATLAPAPPRGLRKGARHMRLSTAVEDFMADARLRGLSEATRRSYRSDFTLLVGLASVQATDSVLAFTPALVRAYFLALAAKGLSLATLHRRRASISGLATHCLLRRLIADNPLRETPAIRRPKTLPRPFGTEVRQALDALPLSGEDALIRGLLFHAGLRVSEVCGLRVGDVDLGDGEHEGRIRVVGKGNKERVVPLTAELWHLCQDYLLARADLRGDQAGRLKAPLLARQNARPWTRRMVERRTRAWGRRAGIQDEKIIPHRFRHSFATDLLDKAADLREIQALMGHEDIATTAIYLEVTAQRLRGAVNRLSKPAAEQVPSQDSAPTSHGLEA